VQLLFESSYYLRAAFIKIGTEDEEIHWLQMSGRQSEETLPCTLATAMDTDLEESTPSQMSWRRTNSFWKTADHYTMLSTILKL